MASPIINLIRPTSDPASDISRVSHQLRIAGWISLGIFLTVGVLSLFGYLLLRSSLESAKREQQSVLSQLSGLTRIEGLHLIVSSRLRILTNIVGAQLDVTKLLDTVAQISPDSGILDLSLDQESGNVSLRLTPRTLADANALVGRIFELNSQSEIRNARLGTVALDPDGLISMTVTFAPN